MGKGGEALAGERSLSYLIRPAEVRTPLPPRRWTTPSILAPSSGAASSSCLINQSIKQLS